MKQPHIIFILCISIAIISCSKKLYQTNGETIYKTGRNFQGRKMIARSASDIPFVNSCITCHGKNGNAMKHLSIQFNYLSNANRLAVPYNDSLFYRFLDHDLKSDGTKANMGITWKMNDRDKKDLLDYIKTL